MAGLHERSARLIHLVLLFCSLLCFVRCEDQLLASDKEMEDKVTEITKCNKQIESTEESMVGLLLTIIIL